MGEYIPEAHCYAFFHGESWFKCPECKFTFEFYEAIYESNGIKKAPEYSDESNGRFWEKRIFICPKCKKKFRIS